jgi:hypothetical protein
MGRLPPRRTTLRNLEATLKWVDVERPELSRLLLTATEPHGGKSTAVLDADSRPYRNLVAWLNQVAGQSEDEAASSPSNTTATSPGKIETSGAISTAADASADPEGLRSSTPSSPSVRPNRAKDAFDPEIFNRRFRTAKQ